MAEENEEKDKKKKEFEFKILDLGIERKMREHKIMIVDDDPTIHAIVEDSIGEDYILVSCKNAKDAIARVENIHPRIILMDVMMPDMGGYEAVRKLQELEKARGIPVLMFSAMDFDPSTVNILRNEVNVKGFLPKPFKPQQLREAIKKVLEI